MAIERNNHGLTCPDALAKKLREKLAKKQYLVIKKESKTESEEPIQTSIENLEHVVSDAVVSLLNAKGISQKEVAEITQKDKSTISRIFNGTRTFSFNDLKEIGMQKKQIPVASIICSIMSKDSNVSDSVRDVFAKLV